MKKINLILDPNDNNNLPDFDNISINAIDSIFSCSASIILAGNLNRLSGDNVISFLRTIADKLSPGGRLVFELTNYKQTCFMYLNGGMDESTFFSKIKNINNHLNIMDIVEYCKQNQQISLVETKQQEDIISVTVVKVKV